MEERGWWGGGELSHVTWCFFWLRGVGVMMKWGGGVWVVGEAGGWESTVSSLSLTAQRQHEVPYPTWGSTEPLRLK